MKFELKPKKIEAVYWAGTYESALAVEQFCKDNRIFTFDREDDSHFTVYDDAGDEWYTVRVGEWLCLHRTGETTRFEVIEDWKMQEDYNLVIEIK